MTAHRIRRAAFAVAVALLIGAAAPVMQALCTVSFSVVNLRGGNTVTPNLQRQWYLDYQPTIMKDGSKYRMWWCGNLDVGGGNGKDYVWYSESLTLSSGWSTPTAVFTPPTSAHWDTASTCSPSIVRVNGVYYMYYEGIPAVNVTPTQIGVATSTDGISWTRLNGELPIIGPARGPGTTWWTNNPAGQYGAGYPSVTYVGGYFYMAYIDTTGVDAAPTGGYAKTYVIRSPDPTFRTAVEELVSAGTFAPQTALNHTTYAIMYQYGFDWMYSDMLDAFVITKGFCPAGGCFQAIAQKRTQLTREDYTGIGSITISGTLNGDMGVVRMPDGHAPAGSSCNLIPIDIFRGIGVASPDTGSDLAYIGADINTGLSCACATDLDEDGMPSAWEAQWGLNPSVNDASADPDGDGLTNLQEYQTGGDPTGSVRRYFAEGSTGFFKTIFALANPDPTYPAAVQLTFAKDTGATEATQIWVPPLTRRTIDPSTVSAGMASASFATTVESNRLVAVERTMSWDSTGYGANAERAAEAPSTTWYFADGSTNSGFNSYILLFNPHPTSTATVQIKYVRPTLAPVYVNYSVPPHTRTTVDVGGAGIGATDYSADVTSTNGVAIVAERAQYRTPGAQTFAAGYVGGGIPAPYYYWYFPEGATGSYFDTNLTISNPSASAASVTANYLFEGGGGTSRVYSVPAGGRLAICLDCDAGLSNATFATVLTTAIPVVAERTSWWPTNFASYIEASNSAGSSTTAYRWMVADLERGVNSRTNYVALVNPAATATTVSFTALIENGDRITRAYAVNASTRYTLDVAAAFPETANQRFSLLVESSASQIAVEHMTYWNSGGVTWAAGAAAMATPIP